MNEAFFFALLAFMGHSLFSRLFGRQHLWFGVAVALPLGVLQWTVLAVVLLLGAVAVQYALWLLGLLSIYYCWSAWLRKVADTLVTGLVLAFVTALVSLLFIRLGWVQVSFDSIEQVVIGRALAQTGFANEAGTLLASWGVLLPLVQSAGVLVGADVLTAMQPLLWLSMIGTLIASAWQMSKRGRAWAAVASVALVATPYLSIFQSAYIHNSLVSAVFLLIFMAAAVMAARQQQPAWLQLAFLGLLGFTLARTEAPLFAALALVLVASWFEGEALWLRFRALTMAYVAVAVVWCVTLSLLIGTGSDIMNPARVGVLAAVLVAAAALIASPANPIIIGLRQWSPAIIMVVALAAVALGYAWKPEHTLENMRAIESNLFFTGRWAGAWWIVALVLPLLIALDAGRSMRVFVAFIVAFSSLVILLGIMRVPYRLGWGDSANRIFTHLLPIMGLWIMCVLGSGKPPTSPGLPGPGSVFPGIRTLAIAGSVFVAIALSVATIVWQPALASADVLVRRAEGFCPADGAGRYTFDVALATDSPGAYAAACSTGPRSVELEVVGSQRFRWIELQEYAASEVWTDFGVRISADGRQWTPIFDYSPANPGAVASRTGSTLWRIAVPEEPVARFIAVDYRASAGQNRLLLRRMSLVKK